MYNWCFKIKKSMTLYFLKPLNLWYAWVNCLWYNFKRIEFRLCCNVDSMDNYAIICELFEMLRSGDHGYWKRLSWLNFLFECRIDIKFLLSNGSLMIAVFTYFSYCDHGLVVIIMWIVVVSCYVICEGIMWSLWLSLNDEWGILEHILNR